MNAQQPLSPTRSGPVAAIFCGLVLALALSACCGAGRYTPKQGETVAQDIEFIDSRTFDTQVQRAMGVQHPRITVTFPAAITLNSIPERLDKWLYAVQDSGGAVESRARTGRPCGARPAGGNLHLFHQRVCAPGRRLHLFSGQGV